jgi:hypothetical protein
MPDRTLGSLMSDYDMTVLDHLERSVQIPLVDFARQGDVLVVPVRVLLHELVATTPVPAAGLPVVEGAGGAATHLLVGEGDVRFDWWPQDDEIVTVGVLTVGEGSAAYLLHREHGGVGIAPGRYEIRRQREQAGSPRPVSD